MAVKVLITRRFKPDKIEAANAFLMKLRAEATLCKGYVSGQTLVSADEPNKVVVISTWNSRKRWEEWLNDSNRKKFHARMDELLAAPEHVEVFFVGERTPEWVDMA
ncbi:MAG: antibiotic biosynthesis monooxygenase [Desulfomonile tiedjei]|nr:antibiotic biosynthesis monooxygenase [Desulfomonile tiedjei]